MEALRSMGVVASLVTGSSSLPRRFQNEACVGHCPYDLVADPVSPVAAFTIGGAVVGADDDQSPRSDRHGFEERGQTRVDVTQRGGVCLEIVFCRAREMVEVGLMDGRDVDEEKETLFVGKGVDDLESGLDLMSRGVGVCHAKFSRPVTLLEEPW